MSYVDQEGESDEDATCRACDGGTTTRQPAVRRNTAMHAGADQSSKGNDGSIEQSRERARGNGDKDTDELVASGPSQRKQERI